jgi:hypothetical protein
MRLFDLVIPYAGRTADYGLRIADSTLEGPARNPQSAIRNP